MVSLNERKHRSITSKQGGIGMKKILCTSLCIAMLGWAGTAGAVSYFYEMQDGFVFNENNTTNDWQFKLDTDTLYSDWDGVSNPNGNQVNINTEDLIKNLFIEISFYDEDNYFDPYVNSNGNERNIYKETANIIVEGESLLANGPRDFDTETFHRNISASLLSNHELVVTINRISGDFEVSSVLLGGSFIDKRPFNDPVPEPTTMLLFGTGLAGLAATGRRKSSC